MKPLPPGAARSSGEKATAPVEIDKSRFMRVSEVADELRCSKSFVRALVKAKALPARQIVVPNRPPNRAPLLIARADVERMVESLPFVKPAGEAK